MYSNNAVKEILEAAIDSLIDNFISEPYIHRCEHSIHCELYTMLSVHRVLQGLHCLGGENRRASIIHKEWPETIHRPKHRRGNFDLAILDPEIMSNYSISDFSEGRIPPAFVVEIGLNYKLDHLVDDAAKLKNSRCKQGYLVHLWQPHKGIRQPDIDALKKWCNGRKNVAIAVFAKEFLLIKCLKDQTLKSKSY